MYTHTYTAMQSINAGRKYAESTSEYLTSAVQSTVNEASQLMATDTWGRM